MALAVAGAVVLLVTGVLVLIDWKPDGVNGFAPWTGYAGLGLVAVGGIGLILTTGPPAAVPPVAEPDESGRSHPAQPEAVDG
jgi:hypothetical protein